MGAIGGLVKPVTDLASKAVKADKVKSVKLKIKMKKGTQGDVKQDGTRAPGMSGGT